MLVFGYPTEQQKNRGKPARCALRHIDYENAYCTMDGAELREMLSPRAGSGTYDAYMTAFCDRKYNLDFARGMTRSVAKYMQQFEMPME